MKVADALDCTGQEDCGCLVCQMHEAAFDHLRDTAIGLIRVYAERFEVPDEVAGECVLYGLMDVVADIVMTPAIISPEESKIIDDTIKVFRERLEGRRQMLEEEASEAAQQTSHGMIN
jgi:hypothetical protein